MSLELLDGNSSPESVLLAWRQVCHTATAVDSHSPMLLQQRVSYSILSKVTTTVTSLPSCQRSLSSEPVRASAMGWRALRSTRVSCINTVPRKLLYTVAMRKLGFTLEEG
ncbi:MAG: hypothetical protein ACRDRS_02580 [Pseudonocardiaceae bacterium]